MRVLLIVAEPGRPRIELWFDYLGADESFHEQVERAYRGDIGPGDTMF